MSVFSDSAFCSVTHDEFRALKTRLLSDYFSIGTENSASGGICTQEGVTQSILFEDEVLKPFHHDFDRLLNHRKGIQGLTKAKEFKKWWEQSRASYLTRPVVQGYIDAGMSLGDLLDDLHLHYMMDQARKKRAHIGVRVARRLSRAPVLMTLVFSVSMVLQKSTGFLWSLLILGPGVQMVNSYTQPVITPLSQTASQQGSKDLATVAGGIQSWLTHRDKLKEVSQEIRQTTNHLKKVNFQQLSPQEAQAKWAQFEETYFQLFLRYNQTLPSHLRDARGLFRDWMIFTPVGLAANLATFDTQYWIHQKELQQLQQKERDGTVLTGLELQSKTQHKREMAAAESRIAGALAAWKLYEFMYPEITREAAPAADRKQIRNIYGSFVKTMRFDRYTHEFADQIEGVLKQMDATFLLADQLAEAPAQRIAGARPEAL